MLHLLHASLSHLPFLLFTHFSLHIGHLRLMKAESWREKVVIPSLQMTNEVVILLKCHRPSRAAQHPYLFCHLCLKLSPTDYNSSLNTWPEQSPAGGGVYPHNVKWNNLVCQDGQMREVWSWLILCLCVCPSTAPHLSISPSGFFFFFPFLIDLIIYLIERELKTEVV